jgi:NADPH:quinone reductase-like Zn-dependent oxidoreductase
MGVDPNDLMKDGKKIRGFWLTRELAAMSDWERWKMGRAVSDLLGSTLKTHIAGRYQLEDYEKAIAFYKANRSLGKVLLVHDKQQEQK